jgi:hypothetical protein
MRDEGTLAELGVFTLVQARAAGFTDSAVRHAVAADRWIRLRRGVFVVAQDPPGPPGAPVVAKRAEARYAAIAAATSLPRSAISHRSAAIVHDLPTLGLFGLPCLTVPAGTALRLAARAHLHRAALPLRDVVNIDGVRVTSVARTVVDVAREQGVDAGVVSLDAALRTGSIGVRDVDHVINLCRHWPGLTRAHRALALANPLAESPLESVSRIRIAETGLPLPELQTVIGDAEGRFVARVDFYWDEFGVVGEADGDIKYESRQVLIEEKTRQEALEALGLIVVRWRWATLRRFDDVAARLRSSMHRGRQHAEYGRGWTVLGRRAPAELADFAPEYDVR